ncbi:MAG: hypothetical protein RKE49_01465 [Oceanicaulis sp.]
MRGRSALAALLALVGLAGCAGAPQPRPGECAALDAVLGPLSRAAQDSRLAVEIAAELELRPGAEAREAWRWVADFGFAPVWRDPATDDALRRAYRDAWRALGEAAHRNTAAADRRAWDAAYAEVGDDRLYTDESLWGAFFSANRRGGRWACAARFAEAHGAQLVSPQAPRGRNAVRFIAARPGVRDDRALISAWSIYPPFEAGGAERETGTIWLLAPSGEAWRVISARRLDTGPQRP